jgi:hypothetical protein
MGKTHTKGSRAMRDMPDVDIDFGDRTQLLKHVSGIGARLENGNKHNTGVYFTDIPMAHDGLATLDHKAAEQLGYFKLDLLNVGVYERISNELHLVELMREPHWYRLQEREFFEKLIHVGKHYDTMLKMPEPVNSIPRMSMFLAVIRPAKRHLIGLPWAEVAQTIWDKAGQDSYSFKKSHSVAYAQLVAVHMNILEEQE